MWKYSFCFLAIVFCASGWANPIRVGAEPHSQFALGGGLTTVSCPGGAASSDGCSGANQNASFINPTFFATAIQSGQTYGDRSTYTGCAQANPNGCRPPWNVAGVDYPVGYDKATVFKDPKTDTADMPVNCTYHSSAYFSMNGPGVYCSAASDATRVFNGWDFTGLQLFFGAPGGAESPETIIITNNHFLGGGGIFVQNGVIAQQITIKNNTLDGNWPTSSNTNDSVQIAAAGQSSRTPLVLTVTYNAFLNSPSRLVSGTGDYWYETDAFNYANAINLAAPTHGAWGPHGMSVAGDPFYSLQYSYNTLLFPSYGNPNLVVNGMTAPFSWLNGSYRPFSPLQTAQIDHNVVVENLLGGKGGSSFIANGLLYISGFASVGTATIIDNYVDPTGASYMCFLNLGAIKNATLSVVNGVATVTAIGSGSFFPGSLIGHGSFGANWGWPAIMPYGTNGTTGVGGLGTYALSNHVFDNSSNNGKGGWETVNTPITTLNVSGNVNMTDGSAIIPSPTPTMNDNQTGSCHRY